MFNFKFPSQVTIEARIVIDDLRGKKKKFEWFPKFIVFSSQKIKGNIFMISAKISQKFTAEWPSPVDKGGNIAQVQEGSVKFTSDDESIATVEPDPDHAPYGCIVHTGTKTGATAIKIQADANLDDDGDPTTGDDVKTIEGILSVEVLAGEAVGFAEPTTGTPADE